MTKYKILHIPTSNVAIINNKSGLLQDLLFQICIRHVNCNGNCDVCSWYSPERIVAEYEITEMADD